MGALLVVGAAIGAAKGMMNAWNANEQYNETLNDLKQKRQDLEKQYNLGNEIAQNQADRSIRELEANKADTKLSQAVGLGTSAKNIALQEEIQNLQMAELQIQAADAKGSAIQGVATSGVRLMKDAEGNIINAGVRRTELASGRSIALAEAQRGLSRFQNFESARANYLSTSLQINAYQRKIAYTKDELAETLRKSKMLYDQQARDLDRDIAYMDSEEGRRTFNNGLMLDFFASTIGGAFSMGSLG